MHHGAVGVIANQWCGERAGVGVRQIASEIVLDDKGLVAAGDLTDLSIVAWYRGMGLIGVARASQLQLAQPLLTLVWAVALLGETLTPAVPLTAALVLGCIVVTQRARVG